MKLKIMEGLPKAVEIEQENEQGKRRRRWRGGRPPGKPANIILKNEAHRMTCETGVACLLQWEGRGYQLA